MLVCRCKYCKSIDLYVTRDCVLVCKSCGHELKMYNLDFAFFKTEDLISPAEFSVKESESLVA